MTPLPLVPVPTVHPPRGLPSCGRLAVSRSQDHRGEAGRPFAARLVPSVLVAGLVLGLAPGVLLAQAERSADALPAAAPDTGAYAMGWTDFTRYEAPAVCLAAARNVREVARRRLDDRLAAIWAAFRDPSRGAPAPPQVAAVARACGRRFPVAAAEPADLPDVFDLALLAQDDSAAAAALARRLALAPDAAARAALLQGAVDSYLAAEPSRTAAAEALLERFPTLGREGVVAQVSAARSFLVRYGEGMDLPRYQAAAERVLRMAQGLTRDELAASVHPQVAVREAQKALLTLAWLRAPDTTSARTAVRAATERAQAALRALPPLTNPPVGWEESAALVNSPPDEFAGRWIPALRTWYVGRQPPPLEADYWFPKDHPPVPRPGVATLVLEYGGDPNFLRTLRRHDPLLQENGSGPVNAWGSYVWFPHAAYVPSPGDFNQPGSVEDIRRWHEWYGDKLQIVLVCTTTGSAPVTGEPVTPEEEAERLKQYYLDELELPVLLAVRTGLSAHPALPGPDLRHQVRVWPAPDPSVLEGIAKPKTYADSVRRGLLGGPMIVGSDGRLAPTGRHAQGPPMFELALRWAVTGVLPGAGLAPASAAAPASPPAVSPTPQTAR